MPSAALLPFEASESASGTDSRAFATVEDGVISVFGADMVDELAEDSWVRAAEGAVGRDIVGNRRDES